MSRRRNGRSTPARAKYNGSDGGTSKSKQMRKALRFKRRPDLFASVTRTLSDRGIAPTTFSTAGSNTFRVPFGVDKLTISMVGGGGGGGNGMALRGGGNILGGGGGAGGLLTFDINVRPRQVLTFNVGDKGAKAGFISPGGSGGNTTFTDPNTGNSFVAGGGFGGKSYVIQFNAANAGGTGGGNTFSAGASVTVNTEGLSGGLGGNAADHGQGGTGPTLGGVVSSPVQGSGGDGKLNPGTAQVDGVVGKVLIS